MFMTSAIHMKCAENPVKVQACNPGSRLGFRDITPTMVNHMEEKRENEMEVGTVCRCVSPTAVKFGGRVSGLAAWHKLPH